MPTVLSVYHVDTTKLVVRELMNTSNLCYIYITMTTVETSFICFSTNEGGAKGNEHL